MSNKNETLQKKPYQLYNLPWYLFAIFAVVVLVAAYMGVLPVGMAGCFAFMIVLGTILNEIGDHTPIVKSYLGGGAIVIIFGSSNISTHIPIGTPLWSFCWGTPARAMPITSSKDSIG